MKLIINKINLGSINENHFALNLYNDELTKTIKLMQEWFNELT